MYYRYIQYYLLIPNVQLPTVVLGQSPYTGVGIYTQCGEIFTQNTVSMSCYVWKGFNLRSEVQSVSEQSTPDKHVIQTDSRNGSKIIGHGAAS